RPEEFLYLFAVQAMALCGKQNLKELADSAPIPVSSAQSILVAENGEATERSYFQAIERLSHPEPPVAASELPDPFSANTICITLPLYRAFVKIPILLFNT